MCHLLTCSCNITLILLPVSAFLSKLNFYDRYLGLLYFLQILSARLLRKTTFRCPSTSLLLSWPRTILGCISNNNICCTVILHQYSKITAARLLCPPKSGRLAKIDFRNPPFCGHCSNTQLKLRYCEKATTSEKISHLFWRLLTQ